MGPLFGRAQPGGLISRKLTACTTAPTCLGNQCADFLMRNKIIAWLA